MKIFFWIVGVVAVLAIAVIAAVPIIANTAFVKDRIATAARDATGRDLVIAGDIELSLFPPVHVVVGDVRLANAPGAAADNMVTIGALDMSIDALALIDGAVIIESMTISDPKIWLEANVAGRPNWDIGGAQAPTGSAAGGQGSAASPKSVAPPEIRVGSIRIEGGAMSFRDAAGNEAVRAENISIDLAAPAPENPLTLAGTMAVNGQAVTVEVLVDAFGRALAGERFTLNASLVSPLISAGYEGAVQQAPVPGLDGSMTLDIGSVGDLAAWLGQPLPEGQPDPGPLKLTATLAAEGSAVTLTEAMIESDSLNATATGSFELDGDLTKIVFALEGDQLDIDRYLPPPPPAPVASESEPTSEPEPTADESTPIAPKDLFAMIPDDPLDLTALQSTEADITIRLGGLSAVGYEVGPIDVKLDVIDGALSVLIDEIGLYGGAVTGFLTMTPSDNGVVVDSSISIDQIAVAELAMAAAIDMPVVGIASGTLAVRSEGASARGLAKSAAGNSISASAESRPRTRRLPRSRKSLCRSSFRGSRRRRV